jgi:hypothetical protein
MDDWFKRSGFDENPALSDQREPESAAPTKHHRR